MTNTHMRCMSGTPLQVHEMKNEKDIAKNKSKCKNLYRTICCHSHAPKSNAQSTITACTESGEASILDSSQEYACICHSR